jgi:hypothetical protein
LFYYDIGRAGSIRRNILLAAVPAAESSYSYSPGGGVVTVFFFKRRQTPWKDTSPIFGVIEMTDWKKLRNEYINGNISYREMAEKYGVSYSAVKYHAQQEHWGEKKRKQAPKLEKMLAEKTAEKITEQTANDYVNRQERIFKLSDKLTEKIELAISQLDVFLTEDGQMHQTGYVDTQKLRQIVSSLKDIKELTTEENTATEIKVDFGGGEKYAK